MLTGMWEGGWSQSQDYLVYYQARIDSSRVKSEVQAQLFVQKLKSDH